MSLNCSFCQQVKVSVKINRYCTFCFSANRSDLIQGSLIVGLVRSFVKM